MAVSKQAPLHPDLCGIAAFQILTQLMALLEAKGTIANAERARLFNNTAAGLAPPNDPRVQDMKSVLWQLAATAQAQQSPPPSP